jgi:competence protein ComEC
MICLFNQDNLQEDSGIRVRSMTLVALSFAAGILASEHLSSVVCCLAAAILACCALLSSDRKKSGTALILIAIFVIGALRHAQNCKICPDDISRFAGKTTAIDGVVASDPDIDKDRIRFMFRADKAQIDQHWQPVSGKIMVNLYTDKWNAVPCLEYGARIRLLSPVHRPRDPTNPNAFSWRRYLARQGIYVCAYVSKQSQIRLLPGISGNPIVRLALRTRHFLARSIEQIHPPNEASVVVGMVLGTYAYLPPETFRNFSRTGTLHLLAASGYNCYIVVLLAGPILRMARIMPNRRNIIMIFLLFAYLLIAGARPSLVRAAIMASLFLLAPPLRRVADITNVLPTAAFVMLMIDPSDLFDVGFQLSFSSIIALVTVVPIIRLLIKRPARDNRCSKRYRRVTLVLVRSILGSIGAAAVGTTAITLVTAPIVAHYFNHVSLVSVPANMALALGVPLIFADGFLSPIGASIAPLGKLLGQAGTWLVDKMLDIVNSLGSLQYSDIPVASPSVTAIVGYYLVLYSLLSFVRSRHDQE